MGVMKYGFCLIQKIEMINIKNISVINFNIMPDTGRDIADGFKRLVDYVSTVDEACKIMFPVGVYDIYTDSLTEHEIHISNTHSEEESKSITRHSFMHFNGARDITIDGGGSLIRCHGKMTQISLINCNNINIRNIRFDYIHPTVTEMTVVEKGIGYIDCKVNPDCMYRIVDGKCEWYGENFLFSKGISQIYDSETGFTWREYGPMQDKNSKWEELSHNLLRIHFDGENPYKVKPGNVLQMRNPLRDECGIIISGCNGIYLENMSMYFMSGLGIIAQNSTDIFLDGFNSLPASGRTCACFADFMHFSGCRGTIRIENGIFIGANDDAINIHGTHLLITDVNKENKQITLRFMHSQTFGIGGFELGDRVCAVNPRTLQGMGEALVTFFRAPNPREIILTLDCLPECFCNGNVVENLSAEPDAVISNNYFERIPTRGVLVTTRGKVVISRNTFLHLYLCGIFIANDAKSWYESGPVRNVKVENNLFCKCGMQFIFVKPENENIENKSTVHSNIIVRDNTVELFGSNEAVSVKDCTGFKFIGNKILSKYDTCRISLFNCHEEVIESNLFKGEIIIEHK